MRRVLRSKGVLAMLAAVVLLGTLGGAGVVNVSMVRRAQGRMFTRAIDVRACPVALVLGARVVGDVPSPALEDRLVAALALYHEGKIARVLVSGDHGTPGYDEVNAMRTWLVRRGVPSESVLMDHAGFRTLDSMVRAVRVFGVTSAVLVTQRFHLPRALYLAHAAGIDAVGLVADRRVYEHARRDAIREFVARATAFADVQVWGRGPRVLGARIPIGTAPARATFDADTRE